MSQPTAEPPTSPPTPTEGDAWRSGTRSGSKGVLRNPLLIGAVVVVVAAVIVAVVLSGHSSPSKTTPTGSPEPVAAKDVLSEATADTLANDTISMTVSLTAKSGSTSFSVSGSGGCELYPERACTFTESFAGIKSELEAFSPLTEEFSGGVLYVRLPAVFAAELRKQWVSIPLHSFGQLKSVSQRDEQALSQAPAFLAALKSAVKVTDLGAGTVAGVSVTKYAANVNVQKLETQLRAAFPKEFPTSEPASHLVTTHLRFAIDGQHRLRQVSLKVSTNVQGKPASVTLSVTITSYNAQISVGTPPASEVEPLASLTKEGLL